MKKQTNTIVIAGLAIALLVIGVKAFSSSESQATEEGGSGHLAVSEKQWNFGNIPMSEGIATKEVTLTNDSSSPVTITRMETSCMCTTVQILHSDGRTSEIKGMVGHGGAAPTLSETIEAGETVALLVKFDPNAHGPSATGPINRTVDLGTDIRDQSSIQLRFSGNVVK